MTETEMLRELQIIVAKVARVDQASGRAPGHVLQAKEKVRYITPTPASIAAQVQLVEPGLVLPRQAPAGLEAPQELHIHVEHLHIHIPQGLSELQGTPA